ncbi:MAG: L-threonylcarbamoyladenylate synthase [Planctomycetales bacterium]
MLPESPSSSTAIAHGAELLRAGRLVAFPTETVYGLGAHALDERAVARVFEAKGRPRFDPLIVHAADLEGIARLVVRLPPVAERLAARFWPGPLTLVLPKSALVPDLVTAGCPTVALRIPDHPVALELLRVAGIPVAAPSANLFGRISPTTAAHVADQLGDRIDLILDGGPCRVGVESTVLNLAGEVATLLRPGGTPLEEIERLIGRVQIGNSESLPPSSGLASPGTLPQHYAPRTPLFLQGASIHSATPSAGDCPGVRPTGSIGLLAFRAPTDAREFAVVEVLSRHGDLGEAAANFFAALRRLDEAGLEWIVAETFPEVGLGRALNDRLRRAAFRETGSAGG